MGEVRSKEYIDIPAITRKTINKIGYTKAEYQFDGNSCGVLSAIHEQSSDINRGVDRTDEDNQGAGDRYDVRLCLQRNGKLYACYT